MLNNGPLIILLLFVAAIALAAYKESRRR